MRNVRVSLAAQVWECGREREKLGLTLRSLYEQTLQALVCSDFYGPVRGLAEHGRGNSVKVKFILITL